MVVALKVMAGRELRQKGLRITKFDRPFLNEQDIGGGAGPQGSKDFRRSEILASASGPQSQRAVCPPPFSVKD